MSLARQHTVFINTVDSIFRLLSFNIFIAATLLSACFAVISTLIAQFFESYDFTITPSTSAFEFTLSLIVSIALSVEIQTRLNNIVAAQANISAAESILVALTGSTDYDNALTIKHIDQSLLASLLNQRITNIYIIRNNSTSATGYLRTACSVTVVIYLLFFQPIYTTTSNYLLIGTTHFIVSWISLLSILIMHDVNAECIARSAPYMSHH